MLSKILVGVDGSQPSKKALEYASNLASKYGSELYIVNTTRIRWFCSCATIGELR